VAAGSHASRPIAGSRVALPTSRRAGSSFRR
jgi:hypothetical protein